MGTNYYVRLGSHTEIQVCNLGHEHETIVYDEVHIGKSSHGWKFLFNPYKSSRSAWMDFLWEQNDKIYDEYGKNVSYKELMLAIEVAQENGYTLESYKKTLDVFIRNDALTYEYTDSEGYRISKSKEFC